MENIIRIATEEIARLEKLNKTVDMHLMNVPEGCLKWQNVNGLVMGREVVVSYETQGLPLDIGVVKRIVEQIL
ncbi:MAG: hypothetical protein IJP13_08075 [Lachnospiraceae bacterium]|nr:hypothetical protein [Lachnospiraceae bacterium]